MGIAYRVQRISKSELLSLVSEEEIFRKYIPGFVSVGKKFKSDLRDDGNPSCCISYVKGNLYYKDFGTGEGYNVINYVMRKYGLDYHDSMCKIGSDFGIKPSIPVVGSPKVFAVNGTAKMERIASVVSVRVRPWNMSDKKYWTQFGINRDLLQFYSVLPVSHVWCNDKLLNTNKTGFPLYAYRFSSGVYKIYSPYGSLKWFGNCGKEHIQGYHQLPPLGDTLVITKALKDVMVLSVMGYDAVAPQSECMGFTQYAMDSLRGRFKRIVILFDNDKAGMEGAMKLASPYKFECIHVPVISGSKDISDFVNKEGLVNGASLMHSLL
jgi:hypothetical protein